MLKLLREARRQREANRVSAVAWVESEGRRIAAELTHEYGITFTSNTSPSEPLSACSCCPTCAAPGVEVTTFIDWYHQRMCPACGKEWRGALILDRERELRRGELG